MKLTKHILDQVSYWERTTTKVGFWDEPACRFTLHFKQWWKPRKRITMPWICVSFDGLEGTYRRTEGSYELEHQLKTIA